MKVKNLREGPTYERCKELIAEGKFPPTIIPPMKWAIPFHFTSEEKMDQFIEKLDNIFGKSVDVIDWPDNYEAPWFYILTSVEIMGEEEQYDININLTTDEQLSYMQLAFDNMSVT